MYPLYPIAVSNYYIQCFFLDENETYIEPIYKSIIFLCASTKWFTYGQSQTSHSHVKTVLNHLHTCQFPRAFSCSVHICIRCKEGTKLDQMLQIRLKDRTRVRKDQQEQITPKPLIDMEQ